MLLIFSPVESLQSVIQKSSVWEKGINMNLPGSCSSSFPKRSISFSKYYLLTTTTCVLSLRHIVNAYCCWRWQNSVPSPLDDPTSMLSNCNSFNLICCYLVVLWFYMTDTHWLVIRTAKNCIIPDMLENMLLDGGTPTRCCDDSKSFDCPSNLCLVKCFLNHHHF